MMLGACWCYITSPNAQALTEDKSDDSKKFLQAITADLHSLPSVPLKNSVLRFQRTTGE